jgi:hypothetical protein
MDLGRRMTALSLLDTGESAPRRTADAIRIRIAALQRHRICIQGGYETFR